MPWNHVTTRSVARPTIAGLAAVLLVATTIGSVLVTTQATRAGATTPGTPGVAQPATPIYTEDFQNRPGPTPIVKLSNYTGTTGQTYTADPAWLVNCNGTIASASESTTAAPQVADCGGVQQYWNMSQQLAQALGAFRGLPAPAGNYAVSALTSANPGAGRVEFQTATNIGLAQPNRFLTFSVDVAAINCQFGAPLLQFSLLDAGGTALPVGSAINACTSTTTVAVPALGTAGATTARVGTYTSNGSILVNGASFGVRMVNNDGSGTGNDHAFDNIVVLDATPQLDKSFSPAVIGTGAVSRLTFTVTNTDELAAKAGFNFTDALPVGVTVAPTPAAASTCSAPTITGATPGSASLDLTGSLGAGVVSCTFSVNVTATEPGAYDNCPTTNVVIVVGLNPPACSTLTVTGAKLTVEKALAGPRVGPGDQFTTQIRTGSAGGAVVNDPANSTTAGTGSAITAGSGSTGTFIATAGADYVVTEAAAGGTNLLDYLATISCSDANNLQAGLPSAPGVPLGSGYKITPVTGADITCTITNTPIAPGLTIVKTASPLTVDRAGDVVDYTFVVTNTGNVALTGVGVTDTDFSGSGAMPTITCPANTLSAQASMTCTATYAVTQADVDAGQVTNTATATGTDPSGDDITSEPDSATVVAEQAPSIGLVKSADPAALALDQPITYSFVVTNAGNVTLANITVADTDFSGTGTLSPIHCPVTTLAPAANTTCTATYAVTQADIDAGKLTNTASASATTVTGDDVASLPSTADIPGVAIGVLTLVKTGSIADTNTDGVPDAGDTITWKLVVTNTGAASVNAIHVDDPQAGTVTCPHLVLAPGASMACTAPAHTVTAAEGSAGRATNTATVAGTGPGGAAITPVVATADVPVGPAPKPLATTGTDIRLLLVLAGLLLGLGGLLGLGTRRRLI